ncbi:MAG: tRNA N6-adenosine threonylcarbamoyltransferase [Candidatus Dojkabacteria bacterium]|nr:MAG: tRNA N6-adenosine threonylcarbamoyltransferase [Candidatus Dojkabacteria bacterium]
MLNQITTLAIDTSCDETSCSVVRGTTVLSNILPSQIEFHKKYGGVVPSIAKLAHQERIDNVVAEAMKRAKLDFMNLDAIAVTVGPGLAIALEVGIKKAKEIAKGYNKPLIAINHMEGHLLSCFAQPNTETNKQTNDVPEVKFPALGFLISGGHTEIVLVKNWGKYELVGKTLDDACGEAFDKCGRILGLGYPAGPVISEFAKINRKNVCIETYRKHQSVILRVVNKNTKNIYELPVPMATTNDLNMSFSGLKTAFLNLVCELTNESISNLTPKTNLGERLSKSQILNLASAIEAVTIEQLKIKLTKAIDKYNPNEIWVGGGVIASARVRSSLRSIARKYNLKFRQPYTKKLTTDNGAMIGVAANLKLMGLNSKLKHNPKIGVYVTSFENLDRIPRLELN